jgi:Uma2 family endonuclease
MIATANPGKRTWTEADLQAFPNDGYNYELVNGDLVMSLKNNPEHGEISARLLLGTYAREHRLGVVWNSSTGFWMSNRNCRLPDISFVSKERLKGFKRPMKKFFQGAPDLVIEVLAASNTKKELKGKLEDYFASGTQIGWVVDPDKKSVDVHHSPEDKKTLDAKQVLEGEQLLPGSRFSIAELFQEWEWE